jgi:osmotically inducible protein OsmC
MLIRNASAVWEGNLEDGRGTVKLGSGAFEGKYSFASRFKDGKGTNPEELIGAAHAGCFSMALSGILAAAGYPPTKIETKAKVRLEKEEGGFKIASVMLNCMGEVPGITQTAFQEHAMQAKENCPVSRALTGLEIALEASLTTGHASW